jgi:integrase
MTGHVRRRGKASWEIKFDLGRDPLTGKRRIRYRSFKGTKRQAEIEAARSVAAASTGEYLDPTKTTVAQFLDRWERDWATGNVSPKTLERYSEILRKHIRPRIGAISIQKLQPVALSELYAALLREGRGKDVGLAPRTVGHVHRVLHRALGHAAKWGVVSRNVAGLVSPPRAVSTEIGFVQADRIGDLLKGLRSAAIYPLGALALATGMRRGELLALRWSDVDFDRSLLRVERSLETTKQSLRFKSPKTRHGRRTITLPASAVTELRRQWKTQQEQRLALGIGKAPGDALVFANYAREPLSPGAVTKEWARAMKLIGMNDVTLHSLRHTHASQLIAAGVDVLTVSRRLGHGSPTITLSVYGHLFHNSDDRAATILEATFASIT